MRRGLPALVLVLTLATTACGEDLAFVSSGALEDGGPLTIEPAPLPLVLTWQASEDVLASVGAGERWFVVFVDRAPVAPGDSIGDLVDDDCLATTGCPDQSWFADRGVYVTTEPRLLLGAAMDRRTSERTGAVDRHLATVVVADGTGTRVGDTAVTLPFVVDREGSS